MFFSTPQLAKVCPFLNLSQFSDLKYSAVLANTDLYNQYFNNFILPQVPYQSFQNRKSGENKLDDKIRAHLLSTPATVWCRRNTGTACATLTMILTTVCYRRENSVRKEQHGKLTSSGYYCLSGFSKCFLLSKLGKQVLY